MKNNSTSWTALISALTADGEMKGAKYALDVWRSETPDDNKINLYDATFNYIDNELETAENFVNKFLKESPDNLQGLMLKYIMLSQQLRDEAKEVFKHAQEIASQKGDEWYELGLFLLDVSQLDSSLKAFRKAIVFQPDNHRNWSGIGLVYMRNKEYERAKDAFSKAGELAENPRNIIRFATLELFFGNVDKAIEIFKTNIEVEKNNPTLWLNFGLAYYIKNDYKNAQQCWDKVLEINPHFAYAHYDMACLNVKFGNFEVAFEHLKAASEFGIYFKNVAMKDSDLQPLLNHPELGEEVKKYLGK